MIGTDVLRTGISKNFAPIVSALAFIGLIGGILIHVVSPSGSSFKLNRLSTADTELLSEQPLIVPVQEIDQVVLRANGPSWVTLRRDGRLEFEGNLDGEKVVSNPAEVEIYAGRPDLVEVSAEGLSPRLVGTIDDLRWLPLLPQ